MRRKGFRDNAGLLGSASFLILAAAGGASAQAADPTTQAAPESPAAQTEPAPLPGSAAADVVVTGTRIRGVAAIGSSTIPIDMKTIAERATASTNDILRDVPQVTNFGASGNVAGGAQIQNSSLNNTFANSINLRGLGTTATLTLVDGHRVAPSGANASYTDPDTIPAIALQRVEVVADGASAIYGSDAVAGVSNLRIREPFTGAETSVGGGLADGANSFKVSQLIGHKWERFGFIAVYEHSIQQQLYTRDRPNLYNDDFTAFGGAALSTTAFPGNVSISGKLYPIPPGQNGQNFTLGQLGDPSSPNRQSVQLGLGALPYQRRDTGLVKYDWQINDNLKFFGYGVYSHRHYDFSATAPSGTFSVPATNPYSPCATGKSRTNTVGAACPANGAVTVPYSFIGDLGNALRDGYETAMDFTNGFELSLPHQWKATLAATYGETKNFQSTTGINTNAVNTLLTAPGATYNATVPGQGTVPVVHPTTIPSLNLFCGVAGCNDPASLAYISEANTTVAQSRRKDATLGADGPLFTIPGGTVRLAVGGEITRDDLSSNTTNLASTATVTSIPLTLPASGFRTVTSVYGELYVPLVGSGNAFSLVRRLDASLAVRYDHYSDFGGTVNPKFGINWKPDDWATLHATYGTSFRAPTLADINPLIGGSIVIGPAALGSTLTTASNVVATQNYNSLTTIGGHVGLEPETARTYSLGFDIDPPMVHGLHVTFNYYNIVYKNRIDTPANNAGYPNNLNATPLYDRYVVYNPTYYPTLSTVTQAQFNALLAAKQNSTAPIGSTPTNPVVALIDGTRSNSGSLRTAGLDLGARYTVDTRVGSFNIGGNATYVFTYKYQQVPGGVTYDYVNLFSTIGSPLRFRGRGNVGWTGYGFAASFFANYQNAYAYPNGINFPVNLLPAGVTPSSFGRISPNTTFDLALSYDTRDASIWSPLKNVALKVYVTNLFNKQPPLVLNGSNGYRFDPTQANQLGRNVSLQLVKRW